MKIDTSEIIEPQPFLQIGDVITFIDYWNGTVRFLLNGKEQHTDFFHDFYIPSNCKSKCVFIRQIESFAGSQEKLYDYLSEKTFLVLKFHQCSITDMNGRVRYYNYPELRLLSSREPLHIDNKITILTSNPTIMGVHKRTLVDKFDKKDQLHREIEEKRERKAQQAKKWWF